MIYLQRVMIFVWRCGLFCGRFRAYLWLDVSMQLVLLAAGIQQNISDLTDH
ncbi:hypothetical protein O9929_12865 [Vibrio lentus]|nr:hypothetical protein [Vibrio lentus]